DRPFQRYFTLANLHNNRKVLDHDLRLARAALAKLFNSLSWKPMIVVPRSIDPHETVYVVDLRDLGWMERNLWAEILRFEKADDTARFVGARDETHRGYPYGLDYEKASDEEVRRLAGEVGGLTGCELCFVRADWFIATASRPPLYETILDLPADARVLERRLDVDVEGDFLRDRLARAGFVTSRVSSHNRMVERHEAAFGAYWKSYDFKTDDGTANLLQFPLGPVFDGNPFELHAFEHSGSEIIFNLPNGLQGYLLVNNKDERIEAGPIEVVAGALRTLGTATVVDGLSCISCHRNGMIGGFEDKVREGNAVASEARGKVERLYPRKGEMDRLLSQDEDRFLAALTKATGSILQTGDDKAKPIRDFPEPIGAVARLYLKDLGLDEIAAELGIAEPKDLQSLILANPALQRLGLSLLLRPGGRIKRAAWESLQSVNSPFQEAANQLERGTPLHEL
ncbi:MAG: transcriptional regulator, partial [Isosphaeraceae bacterium]